MIDRINAVTHNNHSVTLAHVKISTGGLGLVEKMQNAVARRAQQSQLL